MDMVHFLAVAIIDYQSKPARYAQFLCDQAGCAVHHRQRFGGSFVEVFRHFFRNYQQMYLGFGIVVGYYNHLSSSKKILAGNSRSIMRLNTEGMRASYGSHGN